MCIGAKLTLSFAVVAVIAGVTGWVGVSGSGRIQAGAHSIYEDCLMPVRELGEADSSFLNARAALYEMFSTADRAERQASASVIERETQKFDGIIEAFAKTSLTSEERELLTRFGSNWDAYRKLRDQAVAHLLRGENAGANQINTALQQSQDVIQQNASAAEETAATSEELAGQAEQLQVATNYFRIGDGRQAHTAVRRPSKPAGARTPGLSRLSTALNQEHPREGISVSLWDHTDEQSDKY